MARAFLREFFLRFNPIPASNPTTSFRLLSSSSSSSCHPKAPTNSISLYHPSLLPLQKCNSMRQLLQIQACLITTGLFQDPFPASRILKFSADFGDIAYTILIFRCIDSPDAFCVNTLIKAYSHSSDPCNAVEFYFEMRKKRFFPNSYTFPPLLNSCAKGGCLDDGEKCHGQAVKIGVDAVVHVRNALVHAYASCGHLGGARQVFDGMLLRDLVSWNSMIDGYAKVGDLVAAHGMFDEMPARNVISWNIMLGGYLRGGNPGCVLKLFREMGRMGIKGTVTTMVSVVTACGRSARLKEGRSVHGYWVRNHTESSLMFETALIDMYCKCQRTEDARRVFDGMEERNLVCWNAMILGHCIQGCPEDGLSLFEEMVQRGCEDDEKNNDRLSKGHGLLPDEVTFIGVLCACARAGLLAKGKEYFNQMTPVYNITPKFAHFWCMANLYGRVGLLKEGEELLRNMTEGSESMVWSGLLGLCRFRGDVNLGEQIANHLIELEPYNSSCYALLWNVYAVAGRWEDVHEVKVLMKDRGIKETSGSSLIDLNKIVHEFKIGDKSQPEMEKIYMLIDELAASSKEGTKSQDPAEFG